MSAPTEMRLLRDIDEPGLDTIEVYERRGGYSALRTALTELEPDEMLSQIQEADVRGRGGAGFAMGKKAGFIPKGDMDKYLVCNADESEPGAFKDRVSCRRTPTC